MNSNRAVIEAVEFIGEKWQAKQGPESHTRSFVLPQLCDDDEIALILEGPEWGHIILFFALPVSFDREGVATFSDLRILGEPRDPSQLGEIKKFAETWL